MRPLRIITINTGKGDGEYRARINWMARELRRLGPDIIACQEVFRDESGLLDTAGTLMRRLGLYGFSAPARYKLRDCEGSRVASWSGLALLSRLPWNLVETLELPSDERDGQRIAVFGLLEDERGKTVVANVHLTHLRDCDELRSRQLRMVLEHPLMQIKGAIRLLCGDLNTTTDGAVLLGLLGERDFGSLQDTYVLGSGATERATLPPRTGMTTGYCVDYVLSLADSSAEQPLFTSSSVVLDRREPRTGLLPSDHYGVATTMVPVKAGSWRRREERRLVI